MNKRNVLALAALLVGGALVAQQPDAHPPKVELPLPKVGSDIVPPPAVEQTRPTILNPPTPEQMTAEQLLEKVKAIRAQKAELEKQEKELLAVLGKKVDKMKSEVDALRGVLLPPSGADALPPNVIPVPAGGAAPVLLPLPGKQ